MPDIAIDEMEVPQLCKYCRQPEYYGKFIWLNGKMMCRSCYISEYEHSTGNLYTWNDLDGPRPTREEVEQYNKRGL